MENEIWRHIRTDGTGVVRGSIALTPTPWPYFLASIEAIPSFLNDLLLARHDCILLKFSNYCPTTYIVQYNYIPTRYLLDVLWGQPIKLAQVASTSELLQNQWNDLVFFKIIPSHFCRASEASKIKYEKFGPKILIPRWKMDTLVP